MQQVAATELSNASGQGKLRGFVWHAATVQQQLGRVAGQQSAYKFKVSARSALCLGGPATGVCGFFWHVTLLDQHSGALMTSLRFFVVCVSLIHICSV